MQEAVRPNPVAEVRLSFLGEAFQWFGKAPGTWCAATVPILLSFAAVTVYSFLAGHFRFQMPADPQESARLAREALLLNLGYLVVYYALFAALIQMGVRQVRGEPIHWTDSLRFGGRLPAVLGATFLVGGVTSLGCLLFCVPGLVAMAGSMMVFPLVTDRGVPVLEAFRLSWQTAGRQIGPCLLLMIAGTAVSQVGFFVLVLGAMVGVPVYALVFALIYREFFEGVPRYQL